MPEEDAFIAYGLPWRTYTCSCGSEMYFKVSSLPPASRLCFSSTEPFAIVQTLEIDFPHCANLEVVTGRDQNTGEEIVENVGTARFFFKWKPVD
ncbi:hypothetical protein GOBAR_AA37343 [Gossypium barbadense]|uniref:Uncharacterized protein n=1 Tax=Gossypium barbadense TaxID=3634 RepID=A0A2P5VX35_GOSBA|nr:hypothetical protein GOBAR_AA37343 [Gossypium barbadense]